MPPKRKKAYRTTRLKKKKGVTRGRKKNVIVQKDAYKFEYICCNCEKSFAKESEFEKHKKECNNESVVSSIDVDFVERTTIKCNECPKIFKFKNNFLKHCVNEHSKVPGSVACDQCHVRCPNKIVLSKHISSTHNREEYACNYCNKTFVRKAHVIRHLLQSGCDGTEAASFPCEICGVVFSRKDNLLVHLRSQHILRKSYMCKYCTYSTKNFSKHVKHWQENHLSPLKFECDICGKTTSSRTSIAKHLEIHGEKKHTCEMCGYKTYTAEVMKRHLFTHLKNKPHKCDICGESYIQKLQLQRHMQRHVGNICKQCGQSFTSQLRLLVHERVHMGLDRLLCPYKDCVYSSREFDKDSSLRNHLRTHLHSKEFKCEVCNKSFFSEVNMKRHVATHRLDRPRRCMYCVSARAYIRGEQLLRHVRQLHPELFRQHLAHVRDVLGTASTTERVKKSELDSILNVLDAESERILAYSGGSEVLYGGVEKVDFTPNVKDETVKSENNPLMSEENLEESLKLLLQRLVDEEVLAEFGWPDESVDTVLEKVIEHCGARAADKTRWTRVQRLRENTKHLFLYAIEDKNIARMLDTHTIDQVVQHILVQVDDDTNEC
ncbi:unnamed protein product [Chilo suppressalis]|uniref:C2H2-type domain-containing protein n=1 Tax=Chilo suppressalis TaxID=168631 RepID=A0ABN8AWG2_CHISP|nr:hypothetical protein evm_005278 [Chilo suppressalis]CAH0400526.1 unnamed protein product [Chilo suppressalis]